MRFGFGWRIDGLAEARRRYREIRGDGRRPGAGVREPPHPGRLGGDRVGARLALVVRAQLRSAAVERARARQLRAPRSCNACWSISMKCVPIVRGSDRRRSAPCSTAWST